MISVIVPVYNAEKYLSECIESILCQTFNNFELILIDDGSTDNSFNICNKYKEQDNRILLLRQENKGVSAARNSGLKAAKGEYIIFIDSDDSIEPDYLKTLFDLLNEYMTDIVTVEYKLRYKDERNIKKYSHKITFFDDFTENNIFFRSVWGMLFKANLFKNITFDENLKKCEDVKILPYIFEQAKSFVYFDEGLYNYRYYNSGLTANNYFDKNLFKITDEIFSYFTQKNKLKIRDYYLAGFLSLITKNIILEAYLRGMKSEFFLINEYKMYLQKYKSNILKNNFISLKFRLIYKLMLIEPKLCTYCICLLYTFLVKTGLKKNKFLNR